MRSGGAHQRIHSLDVCLERASANSGEPIVAPPFVDTFRTIRHHDPTLIEQPLQRAIQRAWSDSNLAVGLVGHCLGYGVAMKLAIGEREQDVKDRRRQRDVHLYRL